MKTNYNMQVGWSGALLLAVGLLVVTGASKVLAETEMGKIQEAAEVDRSAQESASRELAAQLKVAAYEQQQLQAEWDAALEPLTRAERSRKTSMMQRHEENADRILELEAYRKNLLQRQGQLGNRQTAALTLTEEIQSRLTLTQEQLATAKTASAISAELAAAESLVVSLEEAQREIESSTRALAEKALEIDAVERELTGLGQQQKLIEEECGELLALQQKLEEMKLAVARAEARAVLQARLYDTVVRHVARLKGQPAPLMPEQLIAKADKSHRVVDSLEEVVAKNERQRELRGRREAILAAEKAEAEKRQAIESFAVQTDLISSLERQREKAEKAENPDKVKVLDEHLADEKRELVMMQQNIAASYDKLSKLQEEAMEAQEADHGEYLAAVEEARTSPWRVTAGAAWRRFDQVAFRGQDFVGAGGQETGTFVTDNALPTTSPQVQAALNNGPFGVQQLTANNVDSYYSPNFSRSLFEDQEFVNGVPAENVTIAADYVRFLGSRDDLHTSSNYAPILGVERRLGNRGKWRFSMTSQMEYHLADLSENHRGDALDAGRFAYEQYQHALVDVDDNTAIGFQDFLLAINPYDPNRAGLGDGTPTANNTSVAMNNEFEADLLVLELGLKAGYRGERWAWSFGLGASMAYADAESTQNWTASWGEYTSTRPANGLYPAAPFTVPAGQAKGVIRDDDEEWMFGGFASVGGHYYVTPAMSLGTTIRYNAFSKEVETNNATLDLDSMALSLELRYDF